MWQELLHLAKNAPAPWTLVGAHMVALHGWRTVEVPGGSQALQRTEMVEVRVGRISGMIPVPNLLGAILVKVIDAA